MLLLFHVRPARAVVAAVVTYRAISLWLPALIGSLAFLSLRREIGEPVRAAACAGSLAHRRPGLHQSQSARQPNGSRLPTQPAQL